MYLLEHHMSEGAMAETVARARKAELDEEACAGDPWPQAPYGQTVRLRRASRSMTCVESGVATSALPYLKAPRTQN